MTQRGGGEVARGLQDGTVVSRTVLIDFSPQPGTGGTCNVGLLRGDAKTARYQAQPWCRSVCSCSTAHATSATYVRARGVNQSLAEACHQSKSCLVTDSRARKKPCDGSRRAHRNLDRAKRIISAVIALETERGPCSATCTERHHDDS